MFLSETYSEVSFCVSGGLPGSSDGKESVCMWETCLILGLGRSPGGRRSFSILAL